jgi:hypothetical protein
VFWIRCRQQKRENFRIGPEKNDSGKSVKYIQGRKLTLRDARRIPAGVAELRNLYMRIKVLHQLTLA